MKSIAETSTTLDPKVGNRWRARIIEGDIWGSSGFYSRKVIERDGPKTWPKGTAVFMDHPGEAESYDRPERSVRDLVGRIASTPAYESDGLYSDIEFYSWAAPVIAEMASDVGLSIRAYAEGQQGEAAGRKGTVITALHEGLSVDVVTKAGAGGKLMSLLESARRQKIEEAANIGQWIESRLHLALTQYADDMFGDGRLTREERIALSGAVGDALVAFAATLEQSAPQLYERGLWSEPDTAAESGPTNVHPDVPAPAGQHHPTPTSEEDSMGTIQVDEAEHGRLTEAAGRVAQAEQAEQTAVKALAVYKAREAARPAVTKKVGESTLPTSRRARIVESVLQQVRVDENGAANADQLVTITEAEVKAAEVDMAEIAEALGLGQVRNFGATESANGPTVDDFDAAFGVKTSREG